MVNWLYISMLVKNVECIFLAKTHSLTCNGKKLCGKLLTCNASANVWSEILLTARLCCDVKCEKVPVGSPIFS